MLSLLFNSSSARSLDQKQASVSVRRFVVDDRLSVTIFKKTGLIAVARYGLTGGAKLYHVSKGKARALLGWLDSITV